MSFQRANASDLRMGLYIKLAGSWFQHPFPTNTFKIKTDKELATIRSLRNIKIFFDPDKSDLPPEANVPAADVQQPVSLSYGNGPSELLHLVKEFPNLKIIAAHYGGMLGMYWPYPPVRQALNNVYYDTALGVSAGEVAAAYVSVGLSDRILFGSDFPMHSPAKIINDLRRTLDIEILEKVLGGNFLKNILCKGEPFTSIESG